MGAAHRAGIGVVLDVVYNHLGPGSEALEAFGPYHTDRYGTPWGAAMNFDDRDSGGVESGAMQNACMWLTEYRIDGLRVDAVHAIHDETARHVLAELCERAAETAPRPPLLIAESDLNDPKVIRARELGGWGFDAQWADDFHHALHAPLTGERDGYYADFGEPRHLAAATRRPFVYRGQRSAFRRRRHGAPADDRPPRQFVVYSQNHDQVGIRARGDRLPRPGWPLAALWTILSPFTPMLFMGEEYDEAHPFQFFTDHIDPLIADATREGRRREFAEFVGFDEEVPDPQDPATHRRSLLDQSIGDGELRELYERLLGLRADLPQETPGVMCHPGQGWIWMDRGPLRVVGNFGAGPADGPVRERRELVLATSAEARVEDGRLTLQRLAGAVLR